MTKNFSVTTIDFLRHGQCEGGEIFRGSTDVPLTDIGWQQMFNALGEDSHWDFIISSTLQRCRNFSERLSGKHNKQLKLYDELREIHFGDWEGVERTKIQEMHQTSLQAFWNDPVSNSPPNGEAIIDFDQRVNRCFSSIVEEHRGQQLLLVTHGAVIRVLICRLLNMPLSSLSKLSVPYACRTQFKVFHSQGEADWVQLCTHGGGGSTSTSL